MTDPYFLSPGSKSLLTLFGAEHSLGGIAGYEAKETTDENPKRVALIQRASWAYVRHALGIEDASRSAAPTSLRSMPPGSPEPCTPSALLVLSADCRHRDAARGTPGCHREGRREAGERCGPG